MTKTAVPFHLTAQAALERSLAKAAELGVKATIVVLDTTYNVAASVRMDGSWPSAFKVGRAKAWTAQNFGVASATMAERLPPETKSMIPSIEPNLLFLGGGELLLVDGVVRGAVGVSGGSVDQDIAIATAGATGAGSEG